MNDSMDVDMDVDLVVDEEEDEELAQLRARAEEARARDEANIRDAPEVKEAPEEGELQGSDTVPNKVFINGLDSLTTADVRNFVADHFSLDNFKRVEWIDDTSANLIFDNEETATAALQAFSDGDKTKALATHPDIELHVRPATVSDVKLPGAKDRSRFYLLNPEFDPDMRPRRKRPTKRRRNEDTYSRRSSLEGEPFDVNLYDDTVELVSTREHGRLRDRSASPVADGDGKYGFKEQPYRRSARPKSPPRNSNKELFPEKKSLHPKDVADVFGRSSLSSPPQQKRDLFARISGGPREGRLKEEQDLEGFSILGASKENPLVKELFPLKMQTKNSGRELFDGRVKGASQRRRAEDLF